MKPGLKSLLSYVNVLAFSISCRRKKKPFLFPAEEEEKRKQKNKKKKRKKFKKNEKLIHCFMAVSVYCSVLLQEGNLFLLPNFTGG